MNLIFRLIFISLFSRFRSKVGKLDRCLTPFRTAPSDLDVLRHMNNGKYFSIQDLARVDLMIRCGVLSITKKNAWYPVVVGETLQFRRSLKLFEKFVVDSQVIGWTDKHFVLEHIFRRGNQSGEVIAFGIVLARFLKKSGGTVSIHEFLQATDLPLISPPLPIHASMWIEQQQKFSDQFPKTRG